MYKKRSQSSLRAKTQQSEDSNEQNYWIGNANGKKVLNKINQKVTSSMIENNKENSEVNIPIYQSVTEVRPEKGEDTIINNLLQERCKKYEKELSELYGRMKKKDYNYSNQFYEGEISELKIEIETKSKEL